MLQLHSAHTIRTQTWRKSVVSVQNSVRAGGNAVCGEDNCRFCLPNAVAVGICRLVPDKQRRPVKIGRAKMTTATQQCSLNKPKTGSIICRVKQAPGINDINTICRPERVVSHYRIDLKHSLSWWVGFEFNNQAVISLLIGRQLRVIIVCVVRVQTSE